MEREDRDGENVRARGGGDRHKGDTEKKHGGKWRWREDK